MPGNSLSTFTDRLHSIWGPLSFDLAANCREQLTELLATPGSEEWLSTLHEDAPPHRELYRDPTHDFILLAHAEPKAQYRPPHDHGGGWVIYGVQRGEIEMNLYDRIEGPIEQTKLVKRETCIVGPGQCKVFLPGDIHETRVLSGPVLLFRLTSCDFIKEEKEGRLKRYVQRDGLWTESKPKS